MEWFAGLLLGLTVLLVFAEMVARTGFERSLLWSQESARFVFLWIIYIGAVAASRKDSHVRINLVLNRLPSFWQEGITVVVRALSIVFLAIVAFSGGRVALLNLNVRSDALDIPMGYVFAIVPVSAVCMAVIVLGQALGQIRRLAGGSKDVS